MEATLKKLHEHETKYTAELNGTLKQYAELKEQAADMDVVKLMDAWFDIRPNMERAAVDRIKTSYGEKYDPLIMYDSKQDIADLLGEEAEVQSIQKHLHQKRQPQPQSQQKLRHHEPER